VYRQPGSVAIADVIIAVIVVVVAVVVIVGSGGGGGGGTRCSDASKAAEGANTSVYVGNDAWEGDGKETTPFYILGQRRRHRCRRRR
jgi:hypothetical protein